MQQTTQENPKAYRLPKAVRPSRYDIAVSVDPAASDFSGEVAIAITLDEPTDRIVVHGRSLNVSSARVESGGASQTAQVNVEEPRETIELVLPSKVPAGEAVVHIAWNAPVGQAMAGLYLSRDGDERCLATQCEATDARAIFPCFDEPTFKAHFAWTVTAPSGLQVLANGPVEGQSDNGDGTSTWTFAPTPRMSSYLAAIAVGPFAANEVVEARGVPFQVWALSGKERLGARGRDFAARLVAWYEDYFGVPFHWGKYDQIAVPSFAFGAMENPGLVVFRPSLLLMDPATASWRDQKHVDLVVAHEFAHMWFGNLVTMAWWDDLWLNEAFAEWIAHKSVDELEPSEEVWMEFEGRTGGALATDALASTHAIYFPVQTPDEAGELFDAVTYGKGSAVMRMLEAFLGPDAFRDGLRSYMQAFAESNAQGKDLWEHLAKCSDQPVADIMGSWIAQPGHPIIRVELESHDAGALRLQVSQTRARSSPQAPATDQQWVVPLVIRYVDDDGAHEARHLLSGAQSVIDLPVAGALKWLHANANGVGFYRTNPDDRLLDALMAAWGDLTPPERLGLLRDQWLLVRCGEQPMGRLLKMLDAVLAADEHYAVVDHAAALMRELERILEWGGDDAALAGLRAWVAARYQPGLAKLGAEPTAGEDAPTTERRASLLRLAGGIGRDPDALAMASRLAAAERDDPASVEAAAASQAVATSAAVGDAAHFDVHFDTYKARRDGAASPQEVERYLYTLGSFRDPALVARVLELVQGDDIPAQGVGPIIARMLGEPHSQDAAWAHLKEHWAHLHETLGEAWTNILVESTGGLHPRSAADVVAFLEEHLKGTAQQSFGRARERLEERAEFLERVSADLAEWARATS